MAFYLKYRPQKFANLVGQDHISRTLLSAIKNNMTSHAYLLTGPRGTGKTTTARLLAKAINCTGLVEAEPCNECDSCREIARGTALDIIEIDAASHTGVDDIRELIGKAQFTPGKAKKKVYIIDEVHMLSKSAFNALLKTLEEPPEHVVFILATTEVSKLPATILSRVQRYDFKRVSKEEIKTNLSKIAKAEKIKIEDGALDLIALKAAGGHRDGISIFEQVAGFSNNIKLKDVQHILGIAGSEEVFKLIGAIFNTNPEEGLKIAHSLYESGIDITELMNEVIESLRQILLFQMSGQALFEQTAENTVKIKYLSRTSSDVAEILRVFVEKSKLIKEVSNQLLPIEMAIVAACSSKSEARVSKSEINPQAQNPSSKTILNNQKDDKEKRSEIGKIQENKIEEKEIPVPEMTENIWQNILVLAKVQNASLFALLRDAKPTKITEERLVLNVRFKFHKDKISESKNRDILERIIKEVTGVDYQVVCELIDPKAVNKEIKPASDDELQAAVGEVFEIAE